MEGQRRLKNAKVLMIGAGGLGAPLGLYLAAAGIGRIGMVDFDVVDVTNLQRQVIHGTKDEVVLYADTMALVEKLIDQGKTFELVSLPGTGHAWARQSRTLTRFAYGKLASFFERHLKA